jgi:MSHA biogenesis protein MshJ
VKLLWQRYSARVDAASLRERAMIFAAAALVLVTVLQSVFIEPQLREQRRLAAEQTQRQAESAKVQAELQNIALSRRSDPNVEARQRIALLREELQTLNGRIVEQQKKFTAPEQMRTLLEEILARNRKLKLTDLKTLPPVPLSDAKAQDASKSPASQAERLIYRHGLEITLSGAYLDMLSYLSELEHLPTQVYWGSMDFTVAEYPNATLKLVVYTLSLDRAWMVV